MVSGFWRAAVLAAVAIFASDDVRALSFDERWQSLFAESEVAADRVSAKAEMVRQIDRKIEPKRAQRSRAYRHRHMSRRGERRREWYKGGKRWHYVYARRRAR